MRSTLSFFRHLVTYGVEHSEQEHDQRLTNSWELLWRRIPNFRKQMISLASDRKFRKRVCSEVSSFICLSHLYHFGLILPARSTGDQRVLSPTTRRPSSPESSTISSSSTMIPWPLLFRRPKSGVDGPILSQLHCSVLSSTRRSRGVLSFLWLSLANF